MDLTNTGAAGLQEAPSIPEPALSNGEQQSEAEETLLLRRMTTLLCVDDPERADAYAMLVSKEAPLYEDRGPREQTFARMVFSRCGRRQKIHVL